MLGYCNELGVELEVEVNSSRRTLLQNDSVFGGKPIRQGQAINDARGHIAELLAKCVQQGALDQALTPDENATVLAFLKSYGALKTNYQYQGSSRSGDVQSPGAGDQIEIPREPLSFSDLLRSKFCRPMLFEENLDMQPTMFQPVSGMDRIPTPLPVLSGTSSAVTLPLLRLEKPIPASECRTVKANPARLTRSKRPTAFVLCHSVFFEAYRMTLPHV